MSWLINAAQLDKFRKTQKNLVIFDASMFMHPEKNNAKQAFVEKHIPGAQFFDIDFFSDTNTELFHSLISDEALISKKLSELGVRNDYKIIFYDNSPLHSAFRALWMMKMFGHNSFQLYILDGGLAAWEKSGKKIESGETKITARNYQAKWQPQYLRTLSQMKNNLVHPLEQVLDVRHSLRFAGGKEPRPGMRSGHIPHSLCFPYTRLFDSNGCLLPLDKIRTLLESIGVNFKRPIALTCGSGITAPILDFILDLMLHSQHGVYDGSWNEWGNAKIYSDEKNLEERPVETAVDDDIDLAQRLG